MYYFGVWNNIPIDRILHIIRRRRVEIGHSICERNELHHETVIAGICLHQNPDLLPGIRLRKKE